MLGIDLVLPDFTTCASAPTTSRRSCSRTATRTTSGPCPGSCASWGPTCARRSTARPLTVAMARSKIEEHKLKNVPFEESSPGEHVEAGPFELELIHVAHSIPDACAVAADVRARHRDHHGRLQVRPDARGRPADRRRAPGRAGQRGRAAAVRRLDQRRPPSGRRRRRRASGPVLEEIFGARGGSRRADVLRVQRAPPPAGDRCRRSRSTGASRWSAARCARTSTSPASSATRRCPRACSCLRRRSRASPTSGS